MPERQGSERVHAFIWSYPVCQNVLIKFKIVFVDRVGEDLYLYSLNLNGKSYIIYCTYSVRVFLFVFLMNA